MAGAGLEFSILTLATSPRILRRVVAPTLDEALGLVQRIEESLRRGVAVDPLIPFNAKEWPVALLTPATAAVCADLARCALKLEAAAEADAEILAELRQRSVVIGVGGVRVVEGAPIKMRRSRVTLPILAAAFLARLLVAIEKGDRDSARGLGIQHDHPEFTKHWHAPLSRQEAFRHGRARSEAVAALMFASDYAGVVLTKDRAKELLSKARAKLDAKEGFCPRLAALVFGEAIQVVAATADKTHPTVLAKANTAWLQKDENLTPWAQSTRLVTAEQKAWLRGLVEQAATQRAEEARPSPPSRSTGHAQRSRGPSSRPLRRGGRSVRSS